MNASLFFLFSRITLMISNTNREEKPLCVAITDILLHKIFRMADQNCITVEIY